MRDTATTSTIIRNSESSAAQLNTLYSLALIDVLDNSFPIIDGGQPRRFTRRDTEALIVAIYLHSFGLAPKAIRMVLSKVNIAAISVAIRLGADWLIIYSDRKISTFHILDNSIASMTRGRLPALTLDLVDIRTRVERAVLDAEAPAGRSA